MFLLGRVQIRHFRRFRQKTAPFQLAGDKNTVYQKKPRVHNFSARNSGAGNGCANFMGAWHFCVLSAGKNPHAHKIPPFRGGVVGFLERGGWKYQFYFYGRGDCSEFTKNTVCATPTVKWPCRAQRAQRGILMPRGKTCRETIFAAQLPRNYPHRGGNFER